MFNKINKLARLQNREDHSEEIWIMACKILCKYKLRPFGGYATADYNDIDQDLFITIHKLLKIESPHNFTNRLIYTIREQNRKKFRNDHKHLPLIHEILDGQIERPADNILDSIEVFNYFHTRGEFYKLYYLQITQNITDNDMYKLTDLTLRTYRRRKIAVRDECRQCKELFELLKL